MGIYGSTGSDLNGQVNLAGLRCLHTGRRSILMRGLQSGVEHLLPQRTLPASASSAAEIPRLAG